MPAEAERVSQTTTVPGKIEDFTCKCSVLENQEYVKSGEWASGAPWPGTLRNPDTIVFHSVGLFLRVCAPQCPDVL